MNGPGPDADLPRTLGHAFETFGAIRQLARRHEARSPDLFAAFMSAAVAAANGRDAVLAAGAWPTAGQGDTAPGELPRDADPHEVADSIAASAAVLAISLDHAADQAETSQGRQACHDAAKAARQIHQLLAPADDADAR